MRSQAIFSVSALSVQGLGKPGKPLTELAPVLVRTEMGTQAQLGLTSMALLFGHAAQKWASRVPCSEGIEMGPSATSPHGPIMPDSLSMTMAQQAQPHPPLPMLLPPRPWPALLGTAQVSSWKAVPGKLPSPFLWQPRSRLCT